MARGFSFKKKDRTEKNASENAGAKEEGNDSSHMDADLEAVLWSDNPETAYFRQMLDGQQMNRLANGQEDYMDDSVLGNNTISDLLASNGNEKNPSVMEDDSVLGNATLAELMGGSNVIQNSSVMSHDNEDGIDTFERSRNSETTDDDDIPGKYYATSARQKPPNNLSLGVEDDVSTIAGDTLNPETLGSSRSRAPPLPAAVQAPKPVIRDFSEYNNTQGAGNRENNASTIVTTPTKVKTTGGQWVKKLTFSKKETDTPATSPSKSDVESDASPPALPVLNDSYYDYYQETTGIHAQLTVIDKDTSEDNSSQEVELKASKLPASKKGSGLAEHMDSVKRRRILICAVIGGVALLSLIIGLASLLTRMRGNSEDQTDDLAESDHPNGGDDDFVGGIYTKFPVDEQEKPAPTQKPAPAPPAPAAPTPVSEEVADAQTHFLLILANRSSTFLEALEDRQSPQYRSYEWLTLDPDYFSYGNDRILQRWALAILGLGLTDTPARSLTSSAATVLNGTWFTYTNECEWYASPTAEDTPICNENGMYETIRLTDEGLYGEIPSELSILSSHLQRVHLSGNNLYGYIPTEFGYLSNLNTLELNRNALSGNIPTELGLIENLLVLEIGHNSLVGPIPEELGELELLQSLILESNALTGTLPQALGELGQLTSLMLQDNQLTGEITNRLGNLDDLEHLRLEFNLLTGNVPWQVCELGNLVEFAADCANDVGCDCCTECPLTAPPTATPTSRGPTLPPAAVTPMPTNSGPTLQPTVCVDEVKFVSDCLSSGEEIELEFHNCAPVEDDWVGIYFKDAEINNLGEPILWAWLCGNQRCRGEVTHGTILLNETTVGATGDWPVEKGDYRAFLIRRNAFGPYEGYAQTDKYKIENRNKC